MNKSRILRTIALISGLSGFGLVAGASDAEAAGTHFILELQTGFGESAYSQGSPGLAYGLAGGTTFKLKILPVRWYILGNVLTRSGSASGIHEGFAFAADRRDVDLYLSTRTVVPIWKMVRLYGEVGLGTRYLSQTIKRGGDLGNLTASSNELLFILAAGVQVRINKTFSLGIRGELAPLSEDVDLATHAAGIVPTSNRLSAFAQLGVHF